jgi:hypothetical protein
VRNDCTVRFESELHRIERKFLLDQQETIGGNMATLHETVRVLALAGMVDKVFDGIAESNRRSGERVEKLVAGLAEAGRQTGERGKRLGDRIDLLVGADGRVRPPPAGSGVTPLLLDQRAVALANHTPAAIQPLTFAVAPTSA